VPSIQEGIEELRGEPGAQGFGLLPLVRIRDVLERPVLGNPGEMGREGETGSVRVGVAAGPDGR
jgi:hypothetical protein